jgi:hypothetical protein
LGKEGESTVKKHLVLLSLGCSLLLVGCKATPPLPPAQPTADYTRFQLVSSAYLYALDTKTGQLCRTFNENPDIHVPKGLVLDNAKPLDRIPLCIDLSQDEAATIKTLRGK